MSLKLKARPTGDTGRADSCPDCGTTTANVQGISACPDCNWTAL